MPIFKINIKCQLDGVTDVEAPGEDFQYQIKVKCNSCNECTDKWQYVSADDTVEMPGSKKGICNFLIKCKLCNRTNSLDVLLDHKAKYTMADEPEFKTIIAFECRGVSVSDFRFGDGWNCKGMKSRTPFQEIDLSEDWFDYDDEEEAPVSISELEYKII